MKRRNTILFTLLLAGLVPLAIRGCAAMLFVAVPAPVVGEERNLDFGKSQTALSVAPSGAIADARTKYTEAERAVEKFVRSLGKTNRTDADRAALRELVAQAFERRQELLRLELAEFQSRMSRLTQQLADRAEGREKVIDRRVDELLMPNLRWEEPAEAPAQTPENKKVVASAAEKSSQRNQQRAALAAELQGTWLAVEQGSNGEIRPFKTSLTLRFNDSQQYAFQEGDAKPYSLGIYSIPEVASGLPFAALDLTRTYLKQAGGPSPFGNSYQPHVEHAIVSIEGETLRMCWGGQRANDRPDDFTTTKDDGRLLMIYRRVSRKPLGELVSPNLEPTELPADSKGESENIPLDEPPGRGQPRNQTPKDPLKSIEVPLPADKSAAEKLQQLFGFELKPVSGETMSTPPFQGFRGGLQIVSIREKSPAALAGIQKDDIVVGAQVWETLSLEHLQFALERALESIPGEPPPQLKLHLIRTREKVQLLNVSIQIPAPEAAGPKDSPAGGSLTPPVGSPIVPLPEKPAKVGEVRIQFVGADGTILTLNDDKPLTLHRHEPGCPTGRSA